MVQGQLKRANADLATWSDVLIRVSDILGGEEDPDSDEDSDHLDFMHAGKNLGHRAKYDPDDELRQGAMRGNLQMVQTALDNHACVVTINPRGLTPLMMASASGIETSIEVVRELLEKKADMNVCDQIGWDCLHHACRNGRLDVVRLLISAKADCSRTTSDSKTILTMAVLEGIGRLVKWLLDHPPAFALLHRKDRGGRTALHYAIQFDHYDAMKLLLHAKAKPHCIDKDGMQPLMMACHNGNDKCAQFLHKRKGDVNAMDSQNRGPLLHAIVAGHEQLAVWLLKKGADAFQKDMSGITPLRAADENKMAKVKQAIAYIQRQAEEDLEERRIAGDSEHDEDE